MDDNIPIANQLTIRECGHDEYWLQDQIYDNPTCLGLGELDAIDKERRQSGGVTILHLVAKKLSNAILVFMCKKIFLLGVMFFLAGCAESEQKIKGRWYTQSQVAMGKTVFANNCAVCHGDNAQGTFNWQKRLSDGSYPPPPLNGTAHTWHHPMRILKRTIKKGGAELGGKMPAFDDKLSEKEIDAVIAYFQSQWKPEIYEIWESKVNK